MKLCNAVLSSTLAASKLTHPSAYLRLLSTDSSPPTLAASTWHDISAIVPLSEWCATLMVENFVQTQARGDVDANVNQRLARVVTEVFVTVQVGGMINNLTALPSQEAKVVCRLYQLVGYYLRCLQMS